MTDDELHAQDDQRAQWVQVLRSEAGLLHLAVDDHRACELRNVPDRDRTPTVAELENVPADTPASELCRPCFELGRGG